MIENQDRYAGKDRLSNGAAQTGSADLFAGFF